MGETAGALKSIASAQLVFWDFDGVIKDSVEAKSSAFESLFLPFGREIARRVRQHHEANGGVSRFDKIPLYLGWAGESVSNSKVQEFCDRFSQLTLQTVIDSPWVPGVQEFIRENCLRQYFVLVTATPDEDIREILNAIDIAACFREVHGAPRTKASAIADVLKRLNCQPETALMVGDAETDLAAALENSIPFLLRRTSLNKNLQARYAGPMFDNLSHG
jgi:phosphoglycolate phosphatase-like HAD superfamily hydrolase